MNSFFTNTIIRNWPRRDNPFLNSLINPLLTQIRTPLYLHTLCSESINLQNRRRVDSPLTVETPQYMCCIDCNGHRSPIRSVETVNRGKRNRAKRKAKDNQEVPRARQFEILRVVHTAGCPTPNSARLLPVTRWQRFCLAKSQPSPRLSHFFVKNFFL